jgi:hypothetical protein
MSSIDKRSFFRINNELSLSYHGVDAYTVENEKAEVQFTEDSQTLTLYSELHRLNTEATPLLSSIGDSNRVLADYLGILNKKIDLLARHSIAEKYVNNEVDPTAVNMSEGGIAFVARKALYKGSYIVLRLIFLDTFTTVSCYGRIIRCEENLTGAYQVAVKFLHLSAISQQILTKQIFKAQLRMKQKAVAEKVSLEKGIVDEKNN